MTCTGSNRISGRTRKLLIGVAAAALAGGAFAISTGVSSAGENCAGLDQALRNNLELHRRPAGRTRTRCPTRAIANRQAVVDLINQRRATAGLHRQRGRARRAAAPAHDSRPAAGSTAGRSRRPKPPPPPAPRRPRRGEVVCKGSTVTLSGEAGAPAASSGTFPVGTRLKVTNLDNNKSITVRVATTSGSCALLNNAAFEQVREPGKFLIRRAVIERVG